MIEVRHFTPLAIKDAYDSRSWIYSKIVAPREHRNHLLAIQQAHIQPGEKVLEVAVGPGLTLVELANRVGKATTIYGVDFSTRMLQLAQDRMNQEGFTKLDLREADCRELPFENDTFDVLYNGYMLDLIPLSDIPIVLGEFSRVLWQGGRLILLNMSKKDETITLRERLYATLPATVVLYVFGACRPVLMVEPVKHAGFIQVCRTFLTGTNASEIVTATKSLA